MFANQYLSKVNRRTRVASRSPGQYLILLSALLAGCGSAASDTFIHDVDHALKSGDRVRIAALMDWEGWRASGGADPGKLRMVLPAGPLTRTRALAEREYLYNDAEGKSWRLRLVETKGGLKVLALPRACPAGGMRRGPIGDAPVPASPTPPSETFTPLECWPLPK